MTNKAYQSKPDKAAAQNLSGRATPRAKETLLARFADRRRIFASFEPALAGRLASHDDMAKVWTELGDSPDVVNSLYVDVRNALEAAHKEVKRPLCKEEKKGFDKVKKAIDSLRDAIENSSLPKKFVSEGRVLTSQDRPDIPLSLSWHDAGNTRTWGYSIDLLQLLEIYSDLLEQQRVALPPRAVARRKDKALTAAFVRHFFKDSCAENRPKPTAALVACIATAALDLGADELLDKPAIEGILKDCHSAFLLPKEKKLTP